ncbi:LysE family transporter [Flavobacterium aquicola]|uniref:Threonine/homoserine/homoserine lactone efflux protein n=1 Tax=Flavobacterium aquicola TaxID=1682742 RepID=A0A3E0E7H5_9FLAO|nr:LysE family transporter [Flavobacterium aquicola]REG92946.1 threonine/homoserine/homoserine lactone efflux protein [Flavobacterium aquicola]
MTLIVPFILGFIVAAIGITPPGLINMTAAKVSLKDGRNEAISFVIGATIMVFFQTLLALLFANFINSHPDVINRLQELGLFIFIALTIYFFWKAKRPKLPKAETKIRSKTNRFFLGMLLSALNLFPIPYYVFVSITLANYGYFYFQEAFIYAFVVGVVAGSFLVFYLYIVFFKKREAKSSFLMNNGNYIIGTITGLVSIITLFKLIKG